MGPQEGHFCNQSGKGAPSLLLPGDPDNSQSAPSLHVWAHVLVCHGNGECTMEDMNHIDQYIAKLSLKILAIPTVLFLAGSKLHPLLAPYISTGIVATIRIFKGWFQAPWWLQ